MKKDKLFQTFKTLSKEEVKKCAQYISSPYFNTNSNLVYFYNYIKPLHGDWQSEKWDKEAAFKAIFKKENYDRKIMTDNMWRLTKLLEGFLQQQSMEQHYLKEVNLLTDFAERKAIKNFKQHQQKINKKTVCFSFNNAEEYFFQYQLFRISPPTPTYQTAKDTATEAMNALDHFYLMEKLFISHELKMRNLILKKSNKVNFLEEILSCLPESEFLKNPTIKIYTLLLKIETLKHFFDAQNFYKNHIKYFSEHTQYVVLICLLNYLNHFKNQGMPALIKEIFNLYRFGLENKTILLNNKLSSITYSNIVNIGGRLNEFDWVEKFINDFTPYLSENEQSEAQALALGYTKFFQKDFINIPPLFMETKFNKYINELSTKSLLARTYYELFLEQESYYFILKNHLHNTRNFITRKNLSSNKKVRAYYNLINFIKKIATIRFEKKWELMREDLYLNAQNISPMIAKNWLLEKLK